MRLAICGVSARVSASHREGSPPSHNAAPSSCARVAETSKPESPSLATAWLVATAAQTSTTEAAPIAIRIIATGGGRAAASVPIPAAARALITPAMTKAAPATSRQDAPSDAARMRALNVVHAMTMTTVANAAVMIRHRLAA